MKLATQYHTRIGYSDCRARSSFWSAVRALEVLEIAIIPGVRTEGAVLVIDERGRPARDRETLFPVACSTSFYIVLDRLISDRESFIHTGSKLSPSNARRLDSENGSCKLAILTSYRRVYYDLRLGSAGRSIEISRLSAGD
jgi:hypothetical protein